MGITSELREFIDAMDGTRPYEAERLCKVADRIDAYYERDLRETGEEIVADVRKEWMSLPVDADGVPVHVGDVMEWPDGSDEPFEVVGIGMHGTVYYMYDESCEWTNASTKRHHAPTVEDVLMELLNEAEHFHSLEEERDAIAQYAAKLQLANDGEGQ